MGAEFVPDPDEGRDVSTPTDRALDAGESPDDVRGAATGIYENEQIFGQALHRAWEELAGIERPGEVFEAEYLRYVEDGESLRRESPERYAFLRDRIFHGQEYIETGRLDEQIREGVEALETLEGLRPEVWEGLSVDERGAVLQEAENLLAEAAGRPPTEVVVEDLDPGLNGYFDGVIHLNTEFVADAANLRGAVDTVAHEGRHAYQYHAVTNPGFHPDAAEVFMWEVNFSNYLTAEMYGYEAYRNQPVEADAWAFGEGVRDGLYGGGRQ